MVVSFFCEMVKRFKVTSRVHESQECATPLRVLFGQNFKLTSKSLCCRVTSSKAKMHTSDHVTQRMLRVSGHLPLSAFWYSSRGHNSTDDVPATEEKENQD
eukprot:scpid29710/ scgid30549/ 